MGLFDFLKRLLGATGPSANRGNATGGEPGFEQIPSGGYWRRPRKNYRATFKYSPPRNVSSEPYAMAFRVDTKTYHDKALGENQERLKQFGLPLFRTPEDLAKWLAIPLKKLTWIADYYDNNAGSSKLHHYHIKRIAKRNGGIRVIEAPKPILKTIQQRILREILDRVPAHPAAHGFKKGASILSNAKPHTRASVLLKADLSDFYPRVVFRRTAAIFRGLGYNVEVAYWLAKLCTTRCFQRGIPAFYYGRHLPQGAPTSPALANLSCFGLDVRLCGLAKKFNATYTRYADDLIFSGGDELADPKRTGALLWAVKKIIKDERFVVNLTKVRVLRKSTRQVVTGVVVNERPNVSRREFDRLKAILTNCTRTGPAAQNRGKHANFRAHLQGRVAHVKRLNPARAARLQALLDKIAWNA